MVTLAVKTNFPDVQRRMDRLQRDLRDKATTMALNRTLEKGRTEMTRAITSEFNISAGTVRNSLKLRRASTKGLRLVAVLEAFGSRRRGRSLNLIHFVERKVSLAEARRRQRNGTLRQLGFKIKKSGGMKTIPGAFIGNDGRTVFIRNGDKRLPIEPVQTIDVPQMFNTRRINERVLARILREFPVEFDRAARHLLRAPL